MKGSDPFILIFSHYKRALHNIYPLSLYAITII